MAQCSDCHMLVDGHCLAAKLAQTELKRPLPPPPLGACVIPIVEDYLSFINGNMRVLDIGCGSWNKIKHHCEKVGAVYEGVDVVAEYFGEKSVATRIENLASLSFPDEYFDIVIGNQSMEHWAENGCTLEWGLYQCFRVCKRGGRVLLNVPIHFHGTRIFMLGNIPAIESLFKAFSNQTELIFWGYPSDPLPSLFPWPGYQPLQKKPAFVLDIQSIKDRPLPTRYSNKGATRGRRAELLNTPVSFLLYSRLRHHLKLLSLGMKQRDTERQKRST